MTVLRPMLTLGSRPDSDCNAPVTCRSAGQDLLNDTGHPKSGSIPIIATVPPATVTGNGKDSIPATPRTRKALALLHERFPSFEVDGILFEGYVP